MRNDVAVNDDNPRDKFILFATKYIGKRSSEISKSIKTNSAWSGQFVYKVASDTGNMINRVIPDTSSISDIASIGVSKQYGTWSYGSYSSYTTIPDIGDIIYFRNHSKMHYNNVRKYYADRIGIVVDIQKNKIKTIEGYSSGKVENKTYDLGNKMIYGFYHPNWSRLGLSEADSLLVNFQKPFSSETTAMFRQFGYLNTTTYTPSIKSTDGIPLSVMNFNPVASYIFSTQSILSELEFDTSKFSSIEKTILDFVVDKGYSISVAVGLLAVIKNRSNLTTSKNGLLNWNYSDREEMISFVGSNWSSNLSGQLNYIWYKIQEKDIAQALKELSSTLDDAISASNIISKSFFNTSYDTESIRSYWDLVVISLVKENLVQ